MADDGKPVDNASEKARLRLPFRIQSQKVMDTLVVSGIVAVVVAIAGFGYEMVRTRYNDSLDEHVLTMMKKEKFAAGILDLVKKEFEKPKGGVLSDSLRAALSALRQDEVGALSAGSFTLSQDRRTYNLYIYAPSGHQAHLDFDFDWVGQAPQPIVAVFPNGKSMTFMKSPRGVMSIPLPKAGEQTAFETERGQLSNLYSITFQVNQTMTGSVDIKYAAFVAPVIERKR